jgi:hypothetical protein
MSDKRTAVEVQTTGPSYLVWRGELLAELALARLPDLVVHRRPDHSSADLPYDFLVAAEHGFCFFVEVKAFSSFQLDLRNVEEVRELRWSADADLIRRVRNSQNPYLLFLFDADTEHGRYLRVDTLPDPGPEASQLTLRFPVAHAITKESLEQLLADLQIRTKAARATAESE